MASESKVPEDVAPAAGASGTAPAPPTIDVVVVHPLVLLSVTDHYHRVAKDTRKRVVGVLLGEVYKGRVDVTSSFAVPFEEDPKDPTIFFLDHDYLDAMYAMCKKVSAKERILGFYSTGPRIRPADIHIDALFRNRKYVTTPVLVIVDVRPDVEGMPVQAYTSVETLSEAKEAGRGFEHVASEVGAFEAEEVGVEHLLRDINDPTTSSLGGELRARQEGLASLCARLGDVSAYLAAVRDGRLPRNNEILYAVQTALSTLPDTSTPTMAAAMRETVNDAHLALYTGALARGVLALADLTANRAMYKEAEEAAAAGGAPGAGAKKAGDAADAAAAAGGDKKADDKAAGGKK